MKSISRYQGQKGGQIMPTGMTEAEKFQKLLDATAVLICDVSASMDERDAGEGRTETRWEVLVRTVRNLLEDMEGKLAVVAFNTDWNLVAEELPRPEGSTDVGGVLEFVAPSTKFLEKAVLLCDGEPTSGKGDPEKYALDAAKSIRCTLDCVYIGPAGGPGEKFMQRLAQAVRGSYTRFDLGKPALLQKGLEQLLLPKGGR